MINPSTCIYCEGQLYILVDQLAVEITLFERVGKDY